MAIDGRDQHEMWATFRVARRGEIVGVRDAPVARGRYRFEGACQHFHARSAIHTRLIEFGNDELLVTDRVDGGSGRVLTSWLHLHPDFRVESVGARFLATAEGGTPIRICIEAFGVDSAVVHRGEDNPVQGWHFPEFGLALPAVAIELGVRENDGRRFGYRLRLVKPC